MNKYRIVHYCDGVQLAIEELVRDEWKYVPIFRPREKNMVDVRDMTFSNVEDARRAVDRLKARDARLAQQESDRVIE